MSTFNQLVRQYASNPALLERLRQTNPEGFQKFDDYIRTHPGVLLEIRGYEDWLKTLGPHSFTGDFASFHRDIWDWYWPVTEQQQSGEKLDLEDITYLAIWGRGLGKSTMAEWLAIAEGSLVGKGFVLYVCGTAEQAESHVEAIRDRLETEGELLKSYPGMGKPKGERGKGGSYTGEHKQYGWRQDYLMTANGWAIRPVGLDKAIRGWKRGDNRVSMIILDDIDDDDDSPEVILKKERRISKKILPMGTARTKVVFAQNLIHSNSVLNRIHTRQTDILALRKGDEAIKSFESIVIERGIRNVIKSGTPTWPFIDMAECQSFLDRSGYDAFMAEYQHSFEGEQNDRVLPEYDDRTLKTHLITWDQFDVLYGSRRIPANWPCDVGLDIGYTTGHKSAFTFLAKVPEGYPLAGSIFRYRGCVFTSTTIGDMQTYVRARMWPDEKIEREFMSHEKRGELLVMNGEHGWHFQPCDSAKTAGIAQWRHFLRADTSKPHPFHRDEKDKDSGLWKIGCPAWFDIVTSDQFDVPRMKDDLGLKVHREQAYKWKMRKVEETKSGMTVEQPMKADEDSCDATRMLTVAFGPMPSSMTPQQKLNAIIPAGYHRSELAARVDIPPDIAQMTGDIAEFLAKRTFALKQPKRSDEFGQEIR